MNNIMINVEADGKGGAILRFTEMVDIVQLTQGGREALVSMLQSLPSVVPTEVAATSSQLEVKEPADLCEWIEKRFIQAGFHSFQGQARVMSELGTTYLAHQWDQQSLPFDEFSSRAMADLNEMIQEVKEEGFDTIIWRTKPQMANSSLRFRYHFAKLSDWRAKVPS